MSRCPRGCWEVNPGPGSEQVLLTTEKEKKGKKQNECSLRKGGFIWARVWGSGLGVGPPGQGGGVAAGHSASEVRGQRGMLPL